MKNKVESFHTGLVFYLVALMEKSLVRLSNFTDTGTPNSGIFRSAPIFYSLFWFHA